MYSLYAWRKGVCWREIENYVLVSGCVSESVFIHNQSISFELIHSCHVHRHNSGGFTIKLCFLIFCQNCRLGLILVHIINSGWGINNELWARVCEMPEYTPLRDNNVKSNRQAAEPIVGLVVEDGRPTLTLVWDISFTQPFSLTISADAASPATSLLHL